MDLALDNFFLMLIADRIGFVTIVAKLEFFGCFKCKSCSSFSIGVLGFNTWSLRI